jgi:hypothetical protein
MNTTATITRLPIEAGLSREMIDQPTEVWQVRCDSADFRALVESLTHHEPIPQHWFAAPTFRTEQAAAEALAAATEQAAWITEMEAAEAAAGPARLDRTIYHGDGRYTDVYSDGTRIDREEAR